MTIRLSEDPLIPKGRKGQKARLQFGHQSAVHLHLATQIALDLRCKSNTSKEGINLSHHPLRHRPNKGWA